MERLFGMILGLEGTSVVVQCLRLRAPNAGDLGVQIHGFGELLTDPTCHN